MTMRAIRVLTTAVLLTAAAYGIAIAADAMPTSVHAMNGMLMDAKGMTLYTWDNDKEANKSSCNGMCLMNWPALKAEAADKGKPLYYFVMDSAAGDKKGDGRGMVWHIAKP
jgi:predicted lipoprotein with Yx(FWY)xxD motif